MQSFIHPSIHPCIHSFIHPELTVVSSVTLVYGTSSWAWVHRRAGSHLAFEWFSTWQTCTWASGLSQSDSQIHLATCCGFNITLLMGAHCYAETSVCRTCLTAHPNSHDKCVIYSTTWPVNGMIIAWSVEGESMVLDLTGCASLSCEVPRELAELIDWHLFGWMKRNILKITYSYIGPILGHGSPKTLQGLRCFLVKRVDCIHIILWWGECAPFNPCVFIFGCFY